MSKLDENMDTSPGTALLSGFGWRPQALPAWQVDVIVATRPPVEWTTRRNALQPDDMWLSLTLRSFLPWKAALKRHDGLFKVDWTDHGISVDSAQLRYRKAMKWPEMAGPAAFPALVSKLNELFPRGFMRDAEVRIIDADQEVKEAISKWLSGICDQVNFIGC